MMWLLLLMIISIILYIISHSAFFLIVAFILLIALIITYKYRHSLNQTKEVVGILAEGFKEYQEEEKAKKEAIDKQNEVIQQLANYDKNFNFDEFTRLVEKSMIAYLELRNNGENAIKELRNYASESFVSDYLHELKQNKTKFQQKYSNIHNVSMQIQDCQVSGNQVMVFVAVILQYRLSSYDDQGIMRSMKQYHQRFDVRYQKQLEVNEAMKVIINCPNCGASVDVVYDSKCPYCHSVIYHKQNVWLLDQVIKEMDRF